MTVVKVKRSSSRKSKKALVDEKSPLLPTNHGEDAGFDEFDGASFSGAVFNLSTTIVGAGIMSLPATMKVLGLIPGIAAIYLMAFLTESTIELLLRFSRAAKSLSYAHLMGDAFGKYGRMLIQLCVLVNNIGILVVYMIIIGDVLSGTTSGGIHHAGVLQSWFGEQWWNGRFFVLLITTLVVFAPLASLKRIDSLSYTSALSVALAVVFLVITIGITLFKLINGTILMPRLFPEVAGLTSFLNLFTVVPVLVTAYICHYNGTASMSYLDLWSIFIARHCNSKVEFIFLAMHSNFFRFIDFIRIRPFFRKGRRRCASNWLDIKHCRMGYTWYRYTWYRSRNIKI